MDLLEVYNFEAVKHQAFNGIVVSLSGGEVPFIAMNRKEECRSLFKDPDPEADKDSKSNSEDKLMLRSQQVLWAILELDRKWLLLQKQQSVLQSYYNKRFEEESFINKLEFD
ncbi:hypothetical protein L2E82_42471 [Cichorium intybus]|uniref:Uncharacterized protein n=1 Tax=Cichorium intybus TaxID=13427 RepID=A0ACB8ZM49_CICIN|nr:hypothetical protein L2E82_42471 [Cichorium intybus]